MLICGRCGSPKFFYTTSGSKGQHHHGALCAFCHKRLNVEDTRHYRRPAAVENGSAGSENSSRPAPAADSS